MRCALYNTQKCADNNVEWVLAYNCVIYVLFLFRWLWFCVSRGDCVNIGLLVEFVALDRIHKIDSFPSPVSFFGWQLFVGAVKI